MNKFSGSYRTPSRPYDRGGIPKRVKQRANLGDLLRSARQAAGLSVRQAANESGVSSGAISLLEQGKMRSTSIPRLMSLAETYGVEPLGIIEVAGYDLAPALPEFTPYLRAKYTQLPAEAHAELTDAFRRIATKYGVSTDSGPNPGEDETPLNE